jgi:hypothetical protein
LYRHFQSILLFDLLLGQPLRERSALPSCYKRNERFAERQLNSVFVSVQLSFRAALVAFIARELYHCVTYCYPLFSIFSHSQSVLLCIRPSYVFAHPRTPSGRCFFILIIYLVPILQVCYHVCIRPSEDEFRSFVTSCSHIFSIFT